MTHYRVVVAIEKEAEDEGYAAYSPTLPGCFSNGTTVEEVRRNMRDAIRLHIESLLAHGQPVPQDKNLVLVEDVTIAVP